uniref:Succinate-semialdehyde dehydrogenase, mitochondrial n=1 Tax=Dunaliella tertiolecta TaxID=3047 RepID=A0A7S3QKY3_DUNTE|mmetsp:Transcript_1738/g.4376  ORF Transcript_1738/g.4376 Transcript_1738/m.4376 type:complete len:545 (-) Transcript_1738:256-1890(-)
MLLHSPAKASSWRAVALLPAPMRFFSPGSSSTDTREVANAAGIRKDSIAPELLSRLKDTSILHTSGWISGEWTHGSSTNGTFEVRNPATDSLLATMPLMKVNETRAAIAAADSVFPEWRRHTAKERSSILKRWHGEILKHADDLATILTSECGKPLAEARAEIASGAASVEWMAEECRRVEGDVLQSTGSDRRMLTLKQPVGVVGAITPWNFPFSMITRKVAPALAAGCTVVIKPAELTPLSAVALAELAERAGLPDGVLNVVFGDAPAIGHELATNIDVRKIGFTGSTSVGKALAATAAGHVKRISLELGGNAPLIVFDDADLELASAGVVASALRNAGQTCVCANRVFVHESVHDKLADMVASRVQKLRLGDGLSPDTNMGPLISTAAVAKVTAHVDDAVAKGAKVLVGGKKASLASPLSNGTFFEPTVLGDASIDMRLFKEETFGPLIPLFKFGSTSEVVQLANNTEYGLAAYFFTKDLAKAWRTAEDLEYGMVGINEVAITNEAAPFGGVKQSGLGREQSKYGIQEFLDIKYVCMGLGSS